MYMPNARGKANFRFGGRGKANFRVVKGLRWLQDTNMLVSPTQNSGVGGNCPTPTPDAKYFASHWNIGFRFCEFGRGGGGCKTDENGSFSLIGGNLR